jgi:hypothetical protein
MISVGQIQSKHNVINVSHVVEVSVAGTASVKRLSLSVKTHAVARSDAGQMSWRGGNSRSRTSTYL